MVYYTDKKLQFPVEVETPDPLFARALQQAIGGVEGEIRVALQYFFQAWGSRGPSKYRDMLLNTATEETATSKCSLLPLRLISRVPRSKYRRMLLPTQSPAQS